GERRDDGPPLAVLPVRPEVPVSGEEEFGDIRGGPDDERGRDPEDQIPLVIEPPILFVKQCPQTFALSISRRHRGGSCSHSRFPFLPHSGRTPPDPPRPSAAGGCVA